MLSSLNSIKKFLLISVEDKYKNEFYIKISSLNVSRGIITVKAFIILEVIQLLALFFSNKSRIYEKPNLYYVIMYTFLLLFMALFLFIFKKLGKDITRNINRIKAVRIWFTSIILLWCAIISLLDQMSNGQITVYTVAIVSIAVTPIIEPIELLIIYLTVHIFFLILLPVFQNSNNLFISNLINSTAFIIISWAISYMRFQKHVEDFNTNLKLKEANQKLERLYQIDSLTGINNRLVFDKKVKSEWELCKLHSRPISLLMIDIDYFKQFNDSYGHQCGDECLKIIAKVLSESVMKTTDVVTRYGGEEFAIILPDTNKQAASELAEQIRINVEELAIPHANSTVSQYETISLGVSCVIPSKNNSVKEFIKTADEALYKAKKARNCTYTA